MNTDFDHSVKRLTESEECRARATGFATNQQGQAINRQFRPQLADALNADRVYARRVSPR